MSDIIQKPAIRAIIALVVFMLALGIVLKTAELTKQRAQRRQQALQRQEWALHRREQAPLEGRARIRVPRSISAALKELYTVTERQHQDEYKLDDDDTVCPICQASFSRRSSDITCRHDTEIDLEAGLKPHEVIETATTELFVFKKTPACVQAMDTEVLKINRCGHTFHSRCLVTWFLQGKPDCPVCRTTYYPRSKDSESM
ncbi:hypothetical protein F4860DRAFT_200114 [Xylaria cubensis]|nr:hypothetical protein F4860DRAFT_200114 [Xylaria cubensis]